MTNGIHWSSINPRTRGIIMMGLAVGMFMACLDSTIVTTCAKTVAEEMKGTDLYSWIFTAYMLCETIMIPIAGKMSDKYGRKRIFAIGMIIFLIGSVLSANSQTMIQFILFRAIQGVGGGILMPVAMAAVADLYAPEVRGKMQGMLGAVFAVATVLGPTVGGLITDSVGWHWVFYINIPIGIVALAALSRGYPTVERTEVPKTDYLGMSVLGLLLVDVLLLFTWAGSEFQWASFETLMMVMAAIALLAVFIYVEHKAKDPVLALRLFRNKTFVLCSMGLLIFALAMMGAMAYMSAFLQVVMGYTATESGLIMVAMVVSMTITSMTSGTLLSKTGARPWLIVGPVIGAIGMFLLSTVNAGTSETMLLLYLFICGAGLGCVSSVLMTTVQNDAKEDEMGMTTSAASLFRSIGGTVATGFFATIVNAQLSSRLVDIIPESYGNYPHNTGILDHLGELGMYAGDIITAYGESVTFTFMIAAVIMLLVVIVGVVIKDRGVPMETREIKEVPSEG